MTRDDILDKAKQAVSRKSSTYGKPDRNFERIARRWNAHLDNIGFVALRDGKPTELTGVDVATMLADVKLARIEADSKHEDSWVDLAGYAACGAEVACCAKSRET